MPRIIWRAMGQTGNPTPERVKDLSMSIMTAPREQRPEKTGESKWRKGKGRLRRWILRRLAQKSCKDHNDGHGAS